MKRTLVILLLLVPAVLHAQPLHVNAPAVNYVFSPTGVTAVMDKSSAIWGGGFLQSRYY